MPAMFYRALPRAGHPYLLAARRRFEDVRVTVSVRVEERYHVPGSQVWEGSRGGQRGTVHLHVLEPFESGRFKRAPGECLCPKKRGTYERPPDGIDFQYRCTRCADLAERHGLRWPSEIREEGR